MWATSTASRACASKSVGWRSGRATVLPDDDWSQRLDGICRELGLLRRLDGVLFRHLIRTLRTEPVTVRIDLD
jgi:hypothetical protein